MQLFVLLEPAHIKAVRKHIVEIDPRNFLTDASDRDKRKQIKKIFVTYVGSLATRIFVVIYLLLLFNKYHTN